MTPLIALTGYARTGKDCVGDVLVAEYGYTKASMGDIIKSWILAPDMYSVASNEGGFDRWLRQQGRDEARIRDVIRGFQYIYDHDLCFDNYPQYSSGITDHEKQFLRPVLEEYGNWQYENVLCAYLDNLPAKCVNPRICRVEEAQIWKARGGQIWLITRPGVLPATEQEARWVDDLIDGGYIDYTLHNAHASLDLLAQQVRDLITIIESETLNP